GRSLRPVKSPCFSWGFHVALFAMLGSPQLPADARVAGERPDGGEETCCKNGARKSGSATAWPPSPPRSPGFRAGSAPPAPLPLRATDRRRVGPVRPRPIPLCCTPPRPAHAHQAEAGRGQGQPRLDRVVSFFMILSRGPFPRGRGDVPTSAEPVP